MPIVYGGASAQATGTGTSVTPTLPSHGPDDLFVAIVTTREDSPTPTHNVNTDGTNWTQIGTTSFLDLGTTGIAQSVWYRFATSSSETNPSLNNGAGATNGIGGTVLLFRNVDKTTPLDGVTPLNGTNAAATTFQPNGATGITTGTNFAQVVTIVSTSDDNALALLAGSERGFTLRIGGSSYDSTDGGDFAQGTATIEVATAGNQEAPTWNQTAVASDSWAWHLFALRAGPDRGSLGIDVRPRVVMQAVQRAAIA